MRRFSERSVLHRIFLCVALMLGAQTAQSQAVWCTFKLLRQRDASQEAIQALNNRAMDLKNANQSRQALPLLETAYQRAEAELWREDMLRIGVVQNLATVRDDLGDIGAALTLYEKALKELEDIDQGRVWNCLGERERSTLQTRALIATVHNNLGDILSRQNQHEAAIQHWRAALAIRAAEFPGTPILADTLIGLGVALNAQERYQEAREYLLQAVKMEQSRRSVTVQYARALDTLCFGYSNSQDAQQALSLCEQAVSIGERLGVAGYLQTSFLLNLSETYRQLNATDLQGQALMRSLLLAEASGRPELIWVANINMARYFSTQGDLRYAIAFGKRAIDLLQTMRASLGAQRAALDATFMQNKYDAYRELAAWLFENTQIAEALDVLELLRSEEASDFTERAANSRNQRTGQMVSAEDLVRLQAFAGQAQQLSTYESRYRYLSAQQTRRALTGSETGEYQQLTQALPGLRAEALQRIRAWSATQAKSSAANLPSPGMQLPAIGQVSAGYAVVGYLIGEDKSWVYWNQGQGMRVQELQINRRWLSVRQVALAGQIQNKKMERALLEELYSGLFKPIDGQLTAQRIVLSLVDDLRYVPFSALFDGKQYLIERFSFQTYYGSTADATNQQASYSAGTLTAFGMTQESLGEPALPGVAQELCQIVRGPVVGLAGNSVGCENNWAAGGAMTGKGYADAYFTAQFLKDSLTSQVSRTVHVATHFHLGMDDSTSYLVLPNNTRLTLDQFRSARFSGMNLLTLSACDSAKLPGGAQFQGFAAFARERGAGGVLASLWGVADQSTPMLMKQFYSALQSGKRPAQALKASQIAMLNAANGQYANPYYWAAFSLMEDLSVE